MQASDVQLALSYAQEPSIWSKHRAPIPPQIKAPVATLIKRLGEKRAKASNVLSWGAPVPSFGDVTTATVATVGLNPSNREFVDEQGKELSGAARRFWTLNSLGLQNWSDASEEHAELIWKSCQTYFHINPYDIWFRQLDFLLGATGFSYYGTSAKACHLDIVPYATSCKWTTLKRNQRFSLIDLAGNALGLLLRNSQIKVLLLNGASVIAHFEQLAQKSLERRMMARWTLRRSAQAHVRGYSVRGTVTEICGVPLGRRVMVLGFNHNIQSSFGVTNEVRASIRAWIGDRVMEKAQ